MSSRAFTVSAAEAGCTLLDFLARKLQLSRNKAKGVLDQRRVFVNQQRTWMARHPLAVGDRVEMPAPARSASPAATALPVLYRDADYLVINKPAGMMSNGPDSAESRLRELPGQEKVTAVHRLDRDTTGCLWFALHPAARAAALELFKQQRVAKIYRAIVQGRMSSSRGSIVLPLDGLPARTRLTVLRAGPPASHVQLLIETGRTHQIRRHLAALRHPVLGDRMYATGPVSDHRIRQIPRQMLHAFGLTFPHPATRQLIRVKAPLPADFRRVLELLGL